MLVALLAIVAVVVLVLATQGAIATQLGALLANVWVSTMGAVMSFIAAAVGG
jgi:hypothetical protein